MRFGATCRIVDRHTFWRALTTYTHSVVLYHFLSSFCCCCCYFFFYSFVAHTKFTKLSICDLHDRWKEREKNPQLSMKSTTTETKNNKLQWVHRKSADPSQTHWCDCMLHWRVAKEKVDIRKVARIYRFCVVVSARAIVQKKITRMCMHSLPAKTVLLLAFSHIFLLFFFSCWVLIKWQYGDDCTAYKENIFSEFLIVRKSRGKSNSISIINFNSVQSRPAIDYSGKIHLCMRYLISLESVQKLCHRVREKKLLKNSKWSKIP